MTAIPAKSALTGSSVTEGDFKTSLETLIDYLTGMLGSSGTQAAALQSLGALGGTVTTRATAYTVVASDRGQVISCSGTWTLSLTSAATLGSGFVVAAVNTGSGVITIDPAGTETVNGNATWTLNAGDAVAMVSNGVNWLVFASYIKPSTPKQSGMQVFTSNGTFYVPDGVTRVKATVVGGGAGGGSLSSRGGGGAGVSIKNISGLTPGAAIAVTVGAAGSGGVNGNSSSFGSYCAASGGFANGNGGTATGGDINLVGGSGGLAVDYAYAGGGGAGGASGSEGFASGTSGKGGAGMFGAGGNGLSSASGYGNGGGAGNCSGSPGIVIVEW